jgi:predicted NUDIX family NTP pyrophosphohydrolase
MPRTSAGILPFRKRDPDLEVLLVHPGGPFWATRDLGAWSIAKGEYGPDEIPFEAALREFEEETGVVPRGEFLELGTRKQAGGKLVTAWAVELEWDPTLLKCNTFRMEWPRGSGKMQEFPEVDRAAWFGFGEAARRILASQKGFLETLHERLTGRPLGTVLPPRVDQGSLFD